MPFFLVQKLTLHFLTHVLTHLLTLLLLLPTISVFFTIDLLLYQPLWPLPLLITLFPAAHPSRASPRTTPSSHSPLLSAPMTHLRSFWPHSSLIGNRWRNLATAADTARSTALAYSTALWWMAMHCTTLCPTALQCSKSFHTALRCSKSYLTALQ